MNRASTVHSDDPQEQAIHPHVPCTKGSIPMAHLSNHEQQGGRRSNGLDVKEVKGILAKG